ncbi:MAG: hypothetical protein PUE85_10550 [Firmicutes bacterium]|nr:hypothetical protein [Bacillota bacterium]
MKNLAKIISALLIVIILASAVSCAQTEKPTDQTTPSETNEPVTEADPFSHLPDVKFDGKSFRISGQYGSDYKINETATDILSAANYSRNLAISEKYDVKFETVKGDVNAFVDNVLGDIHFTEVGCAMVWLYGPVLMNGCLYNLRDLGYISFDADWWYPQANEQQTFNNKTLAIIGDMDASVIKNMAVVFFNMDLLNDYQLNSEDIYKITNEGGWTLDYIAEIIKPMYKDVDLDGLRGSADFYGFTCAHNMSLDPWPIACGSRVAIKNNEDKIEIALASEKNQQIFDKLSALLSTNSGSVLFSGQNEGDYNRMPGGAGMFLEQRLVFFPSYCEMAFNELREAKFAYGILPYPKYDSEQTEYHTMIQDGVIESYVPRTLPAEDADFVGIILDACASYNRKNVIPVYYDDALKNRYSEDPATAKMVDLINGATDFETSIIFGTDPGLYYAFGQAMKAETSLVVKQSEIESAMELTFSKFYPLFD